MAMGKHNLKMAAIGFGLSVVASSASALSYKMNAMCYMQDQKDAQVQPFNPTQKEIKESGSSFVRSVPTNVTSETIEKKFRVASLSKILVTHWAIAKLGPEYRFKTKISVTPTNADKSCYAHISGSQDIFMGKEMLTTAFDQLKPLLDQQGCNRIEQLSFDEQFVVPFFSPRNAFIIQHRENDGFRGSDPELFYGTRTTLKSLTYFVKNFSKIRVANVKASSAAEFQKYKETVPVKTYSFQSRPLYMMMREFNAYSSNVPPNILFEKLGGADAYASFIKNRLSLTADQIEVHNGSGYPMMLNGNKTYNEVSCTALVRVIQDLDHMLEAYQGSKKFQMADVMAVGGKGEVFSTFKSLYSSSTFENTLVAKTGSADKAITFGGMLSTSEGSLYFGVLTEPEAYQAPVLNSSRTYIRDLVTILAERFSLKAFSYQQLGLMQPTDKYSQLVKEDQATLAIPLR